MDYEQKYKEALERARDLHDNHPLGQPQTWMICEKIFPELYESEDERIRKSLIRNFTNQHSSNFPTTDGFTREQILAWLEKQAKQNYIDADEDWYGFVRWFVKERTDNYTLIPSDDDIHNWGNIILNHARKLLEKQGENHIGSNNEMVKPSDKVGPKFKVGDFILNGDITNKGEYEIFKILKVCSRWYDVENIYDGRQTMITFAQEYTCRLWTIQDAKKGNVLYCKKDDDLEIIVMYLGINIYNNVDSYCRYNSKLGFNIYITNVLSAEFDFITPATKEQRDLLLSKMKEAGYEWDAEKKELKKIKPDFQKIQWKGNNLKEIVEFTGKSPKFNDWFKTWEEYENYVHAHNNIFKLFNEDGSHFEVPVGAWIVKTPDGYNVASKSTFIQNHKWSEEDDYAIEKLLCILDNEQDNYPQLSCNFQELEEIKDWLKSIKPQNRWKPSDLQLEALESAYKQLPNIQHFLQSLYNDLKNI